MKLAAGSIGLMLQKDRCPPDRLDKKVQNHKNQISEDIRKMDVKAQM